MKDTFTTARHFIPLALLASALIAFPGLAQQAPSPSGNTGVEVVELSVFEVTTDRDVGYYSTNAAEAMRMNLALEDIPMNVTIFNQQFLDDILARDTADVLEFDASITQTNENDQYMARGFGVNASFLDGFRQISGLGPQSVNAVERVEIIKGPAAVFFGVGGMGAVVNRISKRPLMRPQTNARILLGPDGSAGFRFDDTRPIPGSGNKFAYRINVVWEETDTYFGTPVKLLNIAPSIMWQPTKKTQFTAQYIYDLRDRASIWDMPVVNGNYHGIYDAGGNWHDYGDFKRKYTIDDDIRHDLRHLAGVDFRHTFSSHFQLHAQYQYESRVQHRKETSPEAGFIFLLSDAVLMTRRFRDRYTDYDNNRVRAELVSQFKTGSVKHRLLGGFAWDFLNRHQDYKDANDYRGGAASGLGVFPDVSYQAYLENPGLVGLATNNMLRRVLPMNVFAPELSPPVFDKSQIVYVQGGLTDTKTKNTEFYANDVATMFHERLLVQGGVRYTETRRDHYAKNTANDIHGDVNPWTYSFGLVWHLNEARTLTLYGITSKVYSPNFEKAAADRFVPPTIGYQQEVGMKFKLLRDRLNGLVCVYDMDMHNIPFPDEDDNYYLVTDQRSKGIELSLHARPFPQWDLYGSYAYTDSWNKTFDMRQWNQPKNAFSVVNKYTVKEGFLNGFSVNLGIIYKSERDCEDTTITHGTNNRRGEPMWIIPEAWRFDLIFNYRIRVSKGTRMNISLKIKNLADKTDIISSASEDRFRVEPGRMWEFFAGVNF
jgi:outer membrane receptor protein involved in Fe transport